MKFLSVYLLVLGCVSPCNRESGENSTEKGRSLSSLGSDFQLALELFDRVKLSRSDTKIVNIDDSQDFKYSSICGCFYTQGLSAYSFFLNHDIFKSINVLKKFISSIDINITLDDQYNEYWILAVDDLMNSINFLKENQRKLKIIVTALSKDSINQDPTSTLFYYNKTGRKGMNSMYEEMLDYINIQGNFSFKNIKSDENRLPLKNTFNEVVNYISSDYPNDDKLKLQTIKKVQQMMYICQKKGLQESLVKIREKAEEFRNQLKKYYDECDTQIKNLKNNKNIVEKDILLAYYKNKKLDMELYNQSLRVILPEFFSLRNSRIRPIEVTRQQRLIK